METEFSIHFFVTGACVNILTVKSAMSGDRVQHSFLCDRSLSKHLLNTTKVKGSNFALLEVFIIDAACASYFGIYGRIK